MEPAQSGFHWQVNIYLQVLYLYTRICTGTFWCAFAPFPPPLPLLYQIKSFATVVLVLKHTLQVPVYI